MACASCGSGGCGTKSEGGIAGCGSNGSCMTGGCNRLNTYDWLSDVSLPSTDPFNLVEVSFKNGSRKGFYMNPTHTHTVTGDMVLVEAETGFDIGKISLSGELVKLQMKKKRVSEEGFFASVIRRANDRDLERLLEARSNEYKTMLRARQIVGMLKLNMKVCDVEYQGDKRKATFFYTADGRVDFRELIKLFAKEFRVKIEMRQIGARQESARLGGIGSCGRELCCSTWLTEFKSVSTAAARYQNLAINQAKLSGQCGRLKCCLNYELDAYMDALESFPNKADRLETEAGTATLIKTDIFKGLMYYIYKNSKGFSKVYPLPVKRVKEIIALNKKGNKPVELRQTSVLETAVPDIDFADVTGEIELKDDPKRRRRRNRGRNKNKGTDTNKDRNTNQKGNKQQGATKGNTSSNKKNSNKPTGQPKDKQSGNKNQTRDSRGKQKSNNSSNRNNRSKNQTKQNAVNKGQQPTKPQNKSTNKPVKNQANNKGKQNKNRGDNRTQNKPNKPTNKPKNTNTNKPQNNNNKQQGKPQNKPQNKNNNRPPKNQSNQERNKNKPSNNQGGNKNNNKKPSQNKPTQGKPNAPKPRGNKRPFNKKRKPDDKKE